MLGGSFQKKNFVEYGFTPTASGNIESTQRTIISGFTNTVISLDPATGRWTDEPPMPSTGETVSVTVSGGWIVVAGGFDGARLIENVPGAGERFDDTFAALRQVVAYDPRSRTWYAQPGLSRSARGHSLAFLGHYLFLFGAKDAEDELIAYDLRSHQSETFTLGYLKSHDNTAVVHEDKVYVVGGADANNNAADYIQVFQLRKTSG